MPAAPCFLAARASLGDRPTVVNGALVVYFVIVEGVSTETGGGVVRRGGREWILTLWTISVLFHSLFNMPSAAW